MAIFGNPQTGSQSSPQSNAWHNQTSRFSVWRGRLFTHRRRLATFAAAGLAVAVGYHVVFGSNGLTAYEQKRQLMRSLDHQMRDLTRENESLQGHVERLQTDPDTVEHQAREELHYTRPGEVIVTLPPETGRPGKAAVPGR